MGLTTDLTRYFDDFGLNVDGEVLDKCKFKNHLRNITHE